MRRLAEGAAHALDSVALRRLYPEALDLCDVWCADLREGTAGDELHATETAVLALFDPKDPADVAERRLDLANLVRQLTELIALDRCGLLPERWLWWDEVPSLGWPAVLAQAQYRLCQIAAVGAPAQVHASEEVHRPVGRSPRPGPDRVPLSGRELRELFPGLVRLLACYHEQLADGDLAEYRESQNPRLLPGLVAVAYLDACGGSGRSAAALAGEFAAFGLLFTGEEEADRALAVLGELPRQKQPGQPWWDDLTWRAWLCSAVADVMGHAGRGACA